MTDQTIHAHEHPIHKALGPDYRYRIPSYQRPYAWDVKHVMALLGDLDDAQAELPDYFLGAIVLVKSPEGYQDVIDGQQRLTTLTILYASLAHLLPESDAKHLRPFLMQEGNPFQGLPPTYRLTVRDQERDFFETYIQQPDGMAQLLAKDPKKLKNEIERRIYANARALCEGMQERSVEDLQAFASYLSQHAFLVVVRAEQFETAYRIFTVMNDRGLELAASDILKADIIGKLPDDIREKYAEIWESTEEALKRDAFSDLFSHIRMIEVRRKATSSILKELQTYVLPNYEPRAFVDDFVVPYGEDLLAVRRAEWQGGSEEQAINQLLRALNDVDNFDWIPPILYVMRTRENDPAAVHRFVVLLDRLASSMHLRRVYVQPRVKRYGQVLDMLREGSSVDGHESPLLLTEEEKRQTVDVLRGDLYGLSGGVAKYVLRRLDEAVTDSAVTWHHEIISIEHVLPQGPPEGSQWTRWFSEDERIRWTHKLANLVPLNRRRNSAAQNFSFEKKKTEYFAVDGQASPFTLTNQVLHKPVWTPEVLAQRQAELVARLLTLWDLHVEPGPHDAGQLGESAGIE